VSRKHEPGTFAQIPVAMFDDHRMTITAIATVCLIATYGEPAFPKEETLAARLGVSLATIKRAISCAKRNGYLEVTAGPMTREGRTSNRYRVLFPQPAQRLTSEPKAGSQQLTGDISNSSLVTSARAHQRPPTHTHRPISSYSETRARECAEAEPARSLTPAGLAHGLANGREGHEQEARQDLRAWAVGGMLQVGHRLSVRRWRRLWHWSASELQRPKINKPDPLVIPARPTEQAVAEIIAALNSHVTDEERLKMRLYEHRNHRKAWDPAWGPKPDEAPPS
jgi:hypothetical protein